jgi:hypothetical protein
MAARSSVSPCSCLHGGSHSSGTVHLHSHGDPVHMMYVGGWSGRHDSVASVPGPDASSPPIAFAWSIIVATSGTFHFALVAAHVRRLQHTAACFTATTIVV